MAPASLQASARSSGPGFALKKASRALAVGDLDNDGDLDIVVSNVGDTADVLQNDGGNRRQLHSCTHRRVQEQSRRHWRAVKAFRRGKDSCAGCQSGIELSGAERSSGPLRAGKRAEGRSPGNPLAQRRRRHDREYRSESNPHRSGRRRRHRSTTVCEIEHRPSWHYPRTPFGVRFSHRTNPEWLAIARSLRANLRHASGVQNRSPKGCMDVSQGWSEATPLERATRIQRTSKRCEDILESTARPGGAIAFPVFW